MVFNPDLTISLRYQKEVGTFLSLTNNDILR